MSLLLIYSSHHNGIYIIFIIAVILLSLQCRGISGSGSGSGGSHSDAALQNYLRKMQLLKQQKQLLQQQSSQSLPSTVVLQQQQQQGSSGSNSGSSVSLLNKHKALVSESLQHIHNRNSSVSNVYSTHHKRSRHHNRHGHSISHYYTTKNHTFNKPELIYSNDSLLQPLNVAHSQQLLYDSCATGEWHNLSSIHSQGNSSSLYHLYGSRIQPHSSTDNITEDLLAFFTEACPTESMLRACYFHPNKSQSQLQSLEKRLFIPSNPSCKQFDPFHFLSLLRNRRLIMIGDSLMNQLFSSLFCALYRITESEYDLDFHKLWRGQCNEILCPFGQANHSHLLGGWIHFPFYNMSITHISSHRGNVSELRTILSDFAYPITEMDIVLCNYGMHFNDKLDYVIETKRFVNDMKHWFASSLNESIPHMFFLDTLPQHFDTPLTGYYQQETSKYHKNYCDPTINETEKFLHDWRNRIAEKAFVGLHKKLHYVSMSAALYSQYDAHVGQEPFAFAPIDCTHWCYPSNIFKYLHMVVFNAIRKHCVSFLSKPMSNKRVAMLPPKIREGLLIQDIDSLTFYLIQNRTRRPFVFANDTVLLNNPGFSVEFVKKLSPFEFQRIPLGSPIIV